MSYRPARSPLTWLGGLLAVYLLVPIVAFVWRFAGSHERGFGAPGLWGALGTSLESASIATLLVALFGVPLASWLARSRGPVAAVVGVLVQLPLAIPPVMSGIVLIYLVGPYSWLGERFDGRLTDSLAGVVIAQTFVAAPFLIIAARSAFTAVDPAYDDLAAALGHGPRSRFWRVSLPIAADGIRAGLVLTWLRALGEYGATVLLAYHPYTLPVFTYVQFSGNGVPTTQAPTALALLIAAVVVGVAQVPVRRLRGRSARPPASEPPASCHPVPVRFDLDVHLGSFRLAVAHRATSHRLAILGPSGAGKSLTLRAIAGLLGPAAGHVEFGSDDVSSLRVDERGIGYLPQGSVLFPGRTAWQQTMFGVGAAPGVAAWWLETLGVDGLIDRLPGELSGGQRQRVALAQALSRQPRLVLLDEPFSAVDAPVRDELRRQLRRLQHESWLSTILVTHDPEEAALLADEVIVVDSGRVLQAGCVSDVYRRPASPQVARLLGIPNISGGTVTTTGELVSGGVRITADTSSLPIGTGVLWSIRPERIVLDERGEHPGEVADVVDLGAVVAVTVRLADALVLAVRTTGTVPPAIGSRCRVHLPAEAVAVWPTAEPALEVEELSVG